MSSKPVMLELFSGSKNVSRAFEAEGFETFSVDLEAKYEPTLTKDIMELGLKELPRDIKVIWASPPCTTFSIASVSHYWEEGEVKNNKALEGRAILLKTLWLITKIKPQYYFIENPRGMMRKEALIKYLENNGAIRRTISYCQYGHKVMKPTDIWTNCGSWIPKPICSPGDSCHIKSPRGSKNGTQGLQNEHERGKIPEQLCEEIARKTKEALNNEL